MEGKEGKWKKEMEKRTLSTLLLNKENEEENPASKKIKTTTTDSHQLLNSIKTVSNPLTTVILNNQAIATPSNTSTTPLTSAPPPTKLASSPYSTPKPPSTPLPIASNVIKSHETQASSHLKQSESKSTTTRVYDYADESDSLVRVLKLMSRIKNPNEFAICGVASEMPGHAGLFIKGYDYITPPLPIYQAEELVKRMRPSPSNVDSKRVGGPSAFTIKDIYEFDACDIEFKNPKVIIC